MPRTPSHLRVVALSLALLPAAVAPAHAGDFFPCLHPEKKSCFDKYCDSTRVVIPSRQVEVVHERPQVIVRETPAREVVTRTVRHQSVAAPLAIGTVYMPMAMPMLGVPACGLHQPAAEAAPHNPLESFHKAELAQHMAELHAERARAELNATLAAQKRVAARLGAGAGNCDPSSVEKKLTELTSQMKEINDRVTSLERLLLIHDNIIRDKVLSATPISNPGTGATTVTPKLPMIPPLP